MKLRVIFFSIIRLYIQPYFVNPTLFESEIKRIGYKYYEYCSIFDQSNRSLIIDYSLNTWYREEIIKAHSLYNQIQHNLSYEEQMKNVMSLNKLARKIFYDYAVKNYEDCKN